LLIFPDTTVLISLHQEIEEAGAFALRPLWSDRAEPIDALRDLVQLWWWRDVRFQLSSTHLGDFNSRKTVPAERMAARRAAVRKLSRDFEERGGREPFLRESNLPLQDEPCALHSAPVRSAAKDMTIPQAAELLPRRGQDKRLVLSALAAGSHVFVTENKKVLLCHHSFMDLGLAILNPARLLEELDASGELDESGSISTAPSPDLSAFARFYGAFASECFGDLAEDDAD
jgi:hypothetical protein